MSADPGGDEPDLGEGIAIDQVDAVGDHISDIEELAVGRDSNVLRHCQLVKLQRADNSTVDHVDFDKTATAELAGEDRIAPVYRKISMIDAGALRHEQC